MMWPRTLQLFVALLLLVSPSLLCYVAEGAEAKHVEIADRNHDRTPLYVNDYNITIRDSTFSSQAAIVFYWKNIVGRAVDTGDSLPTLDIWIRNVTFSTGSAVLFDFRTFPTAPFQTIRGVVKPEIKKLVVRVRVTDSTFNDSEVVLMNTENMVSTTRLLFKFQNNTFLTHSQLRLASGMIKMPYAQRSPPQLSAFWISNITLGHESLLLIQQNSFTCKYTDTPLLSRMLGCVGILFFGDAAVVVTSQSDLTVRNNTFDLRARWQTNSALLFYKAPLSVLKWSKFAVYNNSRMYVGVPTSPPLHHGLHSAALAFNRTSPVTVKNSSLFLFASNTVTVVGEYAATGIAFEGSSSVTLSNSTFSVKENVFRLNTSAVESTVERACGVYLAWSSGSLEDGALWSFSNNTWTISAVRGVGFFFTTRSSLSVTRGSLLSVKNERTTLKDVTTVPPTGNNALRFNVYYFGMQNKGTTDPSLTVSEESSVAFDRCEVNMTGMGVTYVFAFPVKTYIRTKAGFLVANSTIRVNGNVSGTGAVRVLTLEVEHFSSFAFKSNSIHLVAGASDLTFATFKDTWKLDNNSMLEVRQNTITMKSSGTSRYFEFQSLSTVKNIEVVNHARWAVVKNDLTLEFTLPRATSSLFQYLTAFKFKFNTNGQYILQGNTIKYVVQGSNAGDLTTFGCTGSSSLDTGSNGSLVIRDNKFTCSDTQDLCGGAPLNTDGWFNSPTRAPQGGETPFYIQCNTMGTKAYIPNVNTAYISDAGANCQTCSVASDCTPGYTVSAAVTTSASGMPACGCNCVSSTEYTLDSTCRPVFPQLVTTASFKAPQGANAGASGEREFQKLDPPPPAAKKTKTKTLSDSLSITDSLSVTDSPSSVPTVTRSATGSLAPTPTAEPTRTLSQQDNSTTRSTTFYKPKTATHSTSGTVTKSMSQTLSLLSNTRTHPTLSDSMTRTFSKSVTLSESFSKGTLSATSTVSLSSSPTISPKQLALSLSSSNETVSMSFFLDFITADTTDDKEQQQPRDNDDSPPPALVVQIDPKFPSSFDPQQCLKLSAPSLSPLNDYLSEFGSLSFEMRTKQQQTQQPQPSAGGAVEPSRDVVISLLPNKAISNMTDADIRSLFNIDATVLLMIDNSTAALRSLCLPPFYDQRRMPVLQFTFSVIPPAPTVPMRKQVMTSQVVAAEQTADVVTAVSTSMGGGMVALQTGRSTVILEIPICTPEFNESLGRLGHPLQQRIGPDKYGEFLGALICNPALILGFALVHAGIGWVYSLTKSLPLYRGLVWVRFPSLSILPVMFLIEPTCNSAVVVLLYGEEAWHTGAAAFSLALVLSLLVGLWFYLKQSWGAVMLSGVKPEWIFRPSRALLQKGALNHQIAEHEFMVVDRKGRASTRSAEQMDEIELSLVDTVMSGSFTSIASTASGSGGSSSSVFHRNGAKKKRGGRRSSIAGQNGRRPSTMEVPVPPAAPASHQAGHQKPESGHGDGRTANTWKRRLWQYGAAFMYVLDGGVYWKDQPGHQGFCRSHRLLFMDFRENCFWFLEVELVIAAAMGILGGIQLGPNRCNNIIFFVIAFLFVFLILVAYLRPYNSAFLGFFSVITTFLQLLGSSFMAGYLESEKTQYLDLAERMTVWSLYLLAIRSVADLLPKLIDLLNVIYRTVTCQTSRHNKKEQEGTQHGEEEKRQHLDGLDERLEDGEVHHTSSGNEAAERQEGEAEGDRPLVELVDEPRPPSRIVHLALKRSERFLSARTRWRSAMAEDFASQFGADALAEEIGGAPPVAPQPAPPPTQLRLPVRPSRASYHHDPHESGNVSFSVMPQSALDRSFSSSSSSSSGGDGGGDEYNAHPLI